MLVNSQLEIEMSRKLWTITGLCGLVLLTVCAAQGSAQMPEVKSKPAMLTYVANWQFPRSSWPDVEKAGAALDPVLQKAIADGTIVGYGTDRNLVHRPDAETHDDWWSSMSMAGLVKVLDQISASGAGTSSTMDSATKHWDDIYVSHYYNWKAGDYKGAYTHVSAYKLKADAPDNAIEMLSEHLIAPLLEQQLADGTILEYEIDTLAIHTQAPGTFWIVYLTPTPEGLDKVQAAIRESQKAHPLGIEAFGDMTDDSGHRDELLESQGTYK